MEGPSSLDSSIVTHPSHWSPWQCTTWSTWGPRTQPTVSRTRTILARSNQVFPIEYYWNKSATSLIVYHNDH
eukprot:2499513-Amphidinium_carterae.1